MRTLAPNAEDWTSCRSKALIVDIELPSASLKSVISYNLHQNLQLT